MNERKRAFLQGLTKLQRTASNRRLSAGRGKICALPEKRYNASGMPYENQILTGDSIKLLDAEQPGWVDLVFADPPFNIGYLYHGYDDQKKADDYLKFSEDWMTSVHRALKPTGSFYLAIGDDYAAELCVIAKKIGFNMRNWIIWHYTFGQQTQKKFARSHTHILYFTKDPKNFTFNADAVRVASARQTTYGDSRANPKGKLPDDTWYLRPQEVDGNHFQSNQDTWNESRLCGTFKEREGWHGCQMPIAVLDRIIKASSNPNDLVLDPFNGSGTTCISAAMHDRRYVGIDQSEEYVKYARQRMAHAQQQKSASGTAPIAAITSPTRSSKVATATDAFGRPRVARRRAAKTA